MADRDAMVAALLKPTRSSGTLSSYKPTLHERMADLINRTFYGDNREGGRRADKIMNILDFTPVGAATAMYDAGRSAGSGDYLGAGINTAMAIAPGPNLKPKGIRAFHGSPKNFDAFDMKFAGSTTDSGQLGSGLYFGTDPRVAQSAKHRYEADVTLTNPLEVELPDLKTDKRHVVAERLGLPSNATALQKREAAIKAGHDGVVLDYSPTGYKAKEIAVFDDKLIKIVRKYGIAGAIAMGALTQEQAAQMQSQGLK